MSVTDLVLSTNSVFTEKLTLTHSTYYIDIIDGITMYYNIQLRTEKKFFQQATG